ncbi:O-linked N-acetylglucosamine transferase, SPINDLY family protein [Chamaesiphon sp. OTE_20_metabat_361]|uniref:O-linked N-acetylglucosamine transferase, SPINDLY family protein n=1 Tax=Chamaesiphon sp. OTE_20_metabat_361 TaxID=2964689 RepID=UPI00286B3E1E|nr:O-linked N-acetylglucosamine transferase, SPINDLY family protein [Chamaesiphon sp. OTE_20_metabat_361]
MQTIASIPSLSLFASPENAIDFYEHAIDRDEAIVSNYWQLGIAYLFAGREDDARAAWFIPISTADPDTIDDLSTQLIDALDREALKQAEISELEKSWSLRQHIQALAPNFIENIFQAIYLGYMTDRLTPDLLIEWQVLDLVKTLSPGSIDDDLLDRVLESLMIIRMDLGLDLIESCLLLTGSKRLAIIDKLLAIAHGLIDRLYLYDFVTALVEMCDRIQPNTLSILQFLSYVHCKVDNYPPAIAAAENYYQLASSSRDRLFGSFMAQRACFSAGDWERTQVKSDIHARLLAEIIALNPTDLDRELDRHLILTSFFLPYLKDDPCHTRLLQNQVAAIYPQNIRSTNIIQASSSRSTNSNRRLRIGYVAATLKNHSVGWLCRWLIHHHDRESFEIFLYCVNTSAENNFNHHWFRDKVDHTVYFGYDDREVTAQIRADEIDILIDLDSITFDRTCMVMAEKPAPVQVSWLGWDASGLPTIDYFIVDPYVLPENAQEYYQEKLWRLPQTYLGVEGFEVGIPNISRQDLDIPADAIIYFSSQAGFKRHPDNIRCQMKIVAAVPNSYLLIKGKSDPTVVRNLFGRIAQEEGVSFDRLRFLPQAPTEYIHRANLEIADIVLDTFPYNGATTTLETLWMGIPMVTQVGKQFSARNSYTFMLNAGIEEGIAWSQDEYIEWGIKLGLHSNLRMEIREKLRAGRQTAPVWNAKQFTLDMEQAYREMWAKYQAETQSNPSDRYNHN